MLHRVSEVIGHHLEARDGSVGKIKDLLFDDDSWTVRYLVADTGRWLSSRRVLLSPHAVVSGAMDPKKLPVDLTKGQIENSPGIEAHLPVSEQHQRELHAYYGWPTYWGIGPYAMAGVAIPPPATPATIDDRSSTTGAAPAGDPHLRSAGEVKGYKIHALDGTVGHVDDILVDIDAWMIRLIVVDTRNWLPGKKVIITPGVIDRVSWTDSEVAVHVSRDTIKDSPEYSSDDALTDEYVQRVVHYYSEIPSPR